MSEISILVDAINNGNPEEVKKILQQNTSLANQRDAAGAMPLHYAAMNGNRDIVQVLLEYGADINAKDSEFGATPAGWAIEYLREMGAYLGIELSDLSYAIQTGDSRWVERFLKRFPGLRKASDGNGKTYTQLARESNNEEIIKLFEENKGL